MTSHNPSMIYAARSAVHVIAVAGDLDDNAAAQLMHSCDSRLHQLDIGEVALTHIVVDVSTTRAPSPTALAVLELARAEAERRGVGFHLVGAPDDTAHGRRRIPTFPDVSTALTTLDPEHHRTDPARGPVDPDALVIDSW